jgi:hypothetical protein
MKNWAISKNWLPNMTRQENSGMILSSIIWNLIMPKAQSLKPKAKRFEL